MNDIIGRTARFTYGLIAYLVLFAAALFAVGFLAQLPLAPNHLDAALSVPLWQALALDGVLLVGLLAVPMLAAGLGRSSQALLWGVALLAFGLLWQPLGGEVWAVGNPSLRLVLAAAFGSGVALLLYGVALADLLSSSGLSAAWRRLLGEKGGRDAEATLALRRELRQALVLGTLLCAWAAPEMGAAHLLLALAASLGVLLYPAERVLAPRREPSARPLPVRLEHRHAA